MHSITIETAVEQIAQAVEAGRTLHVIRGPGYTAFQVDTPEYEYVQFSFDPHDGPMTYGSK